MDVRVIDKGEFYPTYLEWSAHYGFPARYKDEIDTVVGCFNGEELIYTCFFWNTNSTFCVIGFPFANPHVSKDDKRGGLTALLDGVGLLARQAGYRLVWTTSDTPPVEKALIESGFTVGDKKVDQYIKLL